MSWYIKCWKQYADFSGRARRMEYWMFTLFNTLVFIVLSIPFIVITIGAVVAAENGSGEPEMSPLALLAMAPLFLYGLAVFIPNIAVTVRRFHDQNRSGWWWLVSFVPYIGGLIIIVFMCLEGTAGANRFGPDPLGREGADDDVWPDVA